MNQILGKKTRKTINNFKYKEIMYEILSNSEKYSRRKYVINYHKCILYPGIVDDNTQYRII